MKKINEQMDEFVDKAEKTMIDEFRDEMLDYVINFDYFLNSFFDSILLNLIFYLYIYNINGRNKKDQL